MQTIRSFILTMMLTTAAFSTPLAAQANNDDIDIDALFQQLDEAIEHSSEYEARREQQIDSSRKLFLAERDVEKRLQLAEQLFYLYKPFRNDSAISYAKVCVTLADSLGRPDLSGCYHSLEAYQYSNAGMYVEALGQLSLVDQTVLDRRGLTAYYQAWMHVCGQIGSFTALKDVRQNYYGQQDLYRDSVLMVAEEGSEEYLHLKMDVLCARRLYQDALNVSDSWLSKVRDGTHENAFAAFYRSVVYGKLGNDKLLHYWLAKSALDDVKCAVFDQASLFMLANHLWECGDHDRALRYYNFTADRNMRFTPHLRNYQVGLAMTILNQACQDSRNRNTRLIVVASVATLLLLFSLALLYFRRRQK